MIRMPCLNLTRDGTPNLEQLFYLNLRYFQTVWTEVTSQDDLCGFLHLSNSTKVILALIP